MEHFTDAQVREMARRIAGLVFATDNPQPEPVAHIVPPPGGFVPGDVVTEQGHILMRGGGRVRRGQVLVSPEQAVVAEKYGWRNCGLFVDGSSSVFMER